MKLESKLKLSAAGKLKLELQLVARLNIQELKGSHINTAFYLETLKMCYELLNKAKKDGLLAIESDIEEPDKSAGFSKYPKFLNDHHRGTSSATRCGWRLRAVSTRSILIR